MILREVCLNNTAQQLKEIAKNNGLSGYSKLKKSELVELVANHLVNFDTIEEALLLADDNEFQCFMNVCNGQKLILEEDATNYVYFFMKGYYSINNEKEISVPDDIRRIFPVIANADFMKKRQHFHTILDYCKACVNLYGIVPINHVYKLYSQNQNNTITKEELIDVVSKVQSKGCIAEIRGDEFVHELLFTNDKAYDLLSKKQEGKPFYIPAKGQILNYADDAYTEKNEYYNEFFNFLKTVLLMADDMANDLCYEVECLFGQNLDATDIVKELEAQGLDYLDIAQKTALIQHIMSYTNHIRLWENRGNTKAELGLGTTPCNVVNMIPSKTTTVASKKVGRNDPCPCGSARKYKHCCGK